jgi:hypothetical protein
MRNPAPPRFSNAQPRLRLKKRGSQRGSSHRAPAASVPPWQPWAPPGGLLVVARTPVDSVDPSALACSAPGSGGVCREAVSAPCPPPPCSASEAPKPEGPGNTHLRPPRSGPDRSLPAPPSAPPCKPTAKPAAQLPAKAQARRPQRRAGLRGQEPTALRPPAPLAPADCFLSRGACRIGSPSLRLAKTGGRWRGHDFLLPRPGGGAEECAAPPRVQDASQPAC